MREAVPCRSHCRRALDNAARGTIVARDRQARLFERRFFSPIASPASTNTANDEYSTLYKV